MCIFLIFIIVDAIIGDKNLRTFYCGCLVFLYGVSEIIDAIKK